MCRGGHREALGIRVCGQKWLITDTCEKQQIEPEAVDPACGSRLLHEIQAGGVAARRPGDHQDAQPERFVRKPTQPPILPHAVWINLPKGESTSPDRAGATISIADHHRVALIVEGIGVVSESVVVSPYATTIPTDEVLN